MSKAVAMSEDASRSAYGELWDVALRMDSHAGRVGCPKRGREPLYYRRYIFINLLAALRTLIFLILTCAITGFIESLLPDGGDGGAVERVAVFLFSALISDLLTDLVGRLFGSPSYVEFGERAGYLMTDMRVIHWYLAGRELCDEHCRHRESPDAGGLICAEIREAIAPVGETFGLISRGLRGAFGRRGPDGEAELDRWVS